MFRKKEDEWIIGDEDYVNLQINQENKSVPEKKERKSRKVNQNHKSGEYGIYLEDIGDSGEISRKIPKWKLIIPTIIFLIVFSGIIGYFTCDFDNHGNIYAVSLEQRYERKYMNSADDLLDEIIEISKELQNDSAQLVNNYVNVSAKLKAEVASLKKETTEFSKYVGVPTKFEGYHAQLINFSLSAQTFIEKLIVNYNEGDYSAFREKGLEDYYDSLEKIKAARINIDNDLFRNMEVVDNGID